MRVHAFFNLVLYNVMFIIPLVAIFVAVFFGVTSEKMELLTKEHTGTVKLSTAILLMGLGVFLFFLR